MSGSESWPRKRELTCVQLKKPDDNPEYFTHNLVYLFLQNHT